MPDLAPTSDTILPIIPSTDLPVLGFSEHQERSSEISESLYGEHADIDQLLLSRKAGNASPAKPRDSMRIGQPMFPKIRATATSGSSRDTLKVVEGGLTRFKILNQEMFLRMLYLEQKRTERSQRPFVLVLLESSRLLTGAAQRESFELISSALTQSTRETDTVGWYKSGSVIGIIFTEVGVTDGKHIGKALSSKVSSALAAFLNDDQLKQISLSVRVFPEDWSGYSNGHSASSHGETDIAPEGDHGRGALFLKRLLDIIGSLVGLVLFAPVFFVTAVLVKLTSPGPILFRQQRIGFGGKPFTFLKFRSMHTKNDPRIHQEFINNFIGSKNGSAQPGEGPKVFKLTKDPRLTPIGGFLRKSSLDELPQFLNVLKGEMSLVGPRPPISYEVERYDIWHRRRLLAVKPGITGLWQVTGRSRVTFDEMVRLDLQYARTWTLWLDLKILLKTPRAVLGGQGAF